MATIIESTGTAVSRRDFWPQGALRLADDAVVECLRRSDRRAEELDLLINAGVYRENNLAEPALASLIQEDVGANPGHPPDRRSHGTFSFDVSNGGCGVVTALELLDGFIASRTIELGAVVASDSDPGNVDVFPFPNAGGAMLVREGPAGTGFIAFASETFPEFIGCFESVVAWHPTDRVFPLGPPGRNVLEITGRDDFAPRAVECAERVARRFIAAQGLVPADVDLLVASTYPPEFAGALAQRLQIPGSRVSVPEERFRSAHTAGVIASLDAAARSGKLFTAENVLLVAVGAGITVETALYRHPHLEGRSAPTRP